MSVYFRNLCLAGVALVSCAGAEIGPLRGYAVDVWNSANGLPQNTAAAIAQSSDGYLWIGTQAGLARFDGSNFEILNKQNRPGLADPEVRGLLARADGSLWIATAGGLCRRDIGKITGVSAPKALQSSVWVLFEDSRGQLYAGGNTGLYPWRNGRFLPSISGLPDPRVTAMAEDRRGRVWVATRKGLCELRGGECWADAVPATLRSFDAHVLTADSEGGLWLGGAGQVLRWRGSELVALGRADGIPDTRITGLVSEARGLWISTAGGGILRYAQGQITKLTTNQGLSSDLVDCLYRDRNGTLWAGTHAGGLNRIRQQAFHMLDADGRPEDAMAVLEARDGSLWISTAAGALHFTNGRWTRYTAQNGLSDDLVSAIFEDSQGTIWLGTERGGLHRFDGRRFERIPLGKLNATVLAIERDADGAFWIGTEAGLVRFKNGAVQILTSKQGLASDRISALIPARDGGYWLGTDDGFSLFRDGHFTNFGTRGNGTSSVGTVTGLYEDQQGALWIATLGSGLFRFADGRTENYDSRSGLPDNTIYAIQEDGRGNLWMSSNHGLIRAPRQAFTSAASAGARPIDAVAYGTMDGLRSDECYGGLQPTSWKKRDGTLLFACIGGVVAFDPANLGSDSSAPPVYIERAGVNGKLINRPPATLSVPPGPGNLEFSMPPSIFAPLQGSSFDTGWRASTGIGWKRNRGG